MCFTWNISSQLEIKSYRLCQPMQFLYQCAHCTGICPTSHHTKPFPPSPTCRSSLIFCPWQAQCSSAFIYLLFHNVPKSFHISNLCRGLTFFVKAFLVHLTCSSPAHSFIPEIFTEHTLVARYKALRQIFWTQRWIKQLLLLKNLPNGGKWVSHLSVTTYCE